MRATRKRQPTPKWKKFERLVAALQHALARGTATVEWSDQIEGRQFDVTVRFAHGLYQYLTLIECKDYRVPIKEVEAFVTKSRRAAANKAIIFSSKGFQRGALKVAREENLELYIFAYAQPWPSSFEVTRRAPALIMAGVEVVGTSGVVLHRFPDSRSALQYFGRETVIEEQGIRSSLDQVVRRSTAEWQDGVADKPVSRDVQLSQPGLVTVPYLNTMSAAAIRFTARIEEVTFVDTGGVDPEVLPQMFSLTNALSGEHKLLDASDVWVGFDTVVAANTFYANPMLGASYFCEALDGDLAHYVLVESYQHGELFQAMFSQKVEYARYLVQIDDQPEIDRLRRIYERYRMNLGTDGDESRPNGD